MAIDNGVDGFFAGLIGSSGSVSTDAAGAPSCMKWGSDGELSAVDLQGILQRLSVVDQQASTLMDCPLDT